MTQRGTGQTTRGGVAAISLSAKAEQARQPHGCFEHTVNMEPSMPPPAHPLQVCGQKPSLPCWSSPTSANNPPGQALPSSFMLHLHLTAPEGRRPELHAGLGTTSHKWTRLHTCLTRCISAVLLPSHSGTVAVGGAPLSHPGLSPQHTPRHLWAFLVEDPVLS